MSLTHIYRFHIWNLYLFQKNINFDHPLFFYVGCNCNWYGQPSQRSINIIAYTVKLFGLLLISFAQSDSPCLLLLIFFTLVIFSEMINYLNFDSNYSFGKCFFLITENLRLLKKSQPTNTLKCFPFAYISVEEFNSHYLNANFHFRRGFLTLRNPLRCHTGVAVAPSN